MMLTAIALYNAEQHSHSQKCAGCSCEQCEGSKFISFVVLVYDHDVFTKCMYLPRLHQDFSMMQLLVLLACDLDQSAHYSYVTCILDVIVLDQQHQDSSGQLEQENTCTSSHIQTMAISTALDYMLQRRLYIYVYLLFKRVGMYKCTLSVLDYMLQRCLCIYEYLLFKRVGGDSRRPAEAGSGKTPTAIADRPAAFKALCNASLRDICSLSCICIALFRLLQARADARLHIRSAVKPLARFKALLVNAAAANTMHNSTIHLN
jgi:hypothetical protein